MSLWIGGGTVVKSCYFIQPEACAFKVFGTLKLTTLIYMADLNQTYYLLFVPNCFYPLFPFLLPSFGVAFFYTIHFIKYTWIFVVLVVVLVFKPCTFTYHTRPNNSAWPGLEKTITGGLSDISETVTEGAKRPPPCVEVGVC